MKKIMAMKDLQQ